MVLASYLGAFVDWSDVLAPGERALLPVISASMWQAGKAFQYLDGIFSGVPLLRKLVCGQTANTISLSTRIDVECRPASFRTIRGGTFVAVICDEIAFWRSDSSANPDIEILNAARPSLATTGGMIAAISSPYAQRGEAYKTFKRDYGNKGDPSILVAKAPSRVMNATLSQKVVDRAYERDAAFAAAEYGAEFRTDVEAFVSQEVVESCIEPDIFERSPISTIRYTAFIDPAGGSGGDSMTLGIAHREREVAVLDVLREVRPPFSPDIAVSDFAELLKRYHIHAVVGDRWGGEFVREAFKKLGIRYDISERVKSDLYKELLPLLNCHKVELLDSQRLINQLVTLERRVARGGRDSIDHPTGAHDNIANACAGALVNATSKKQPLIVTDAMLSQSRIPRYFPSRGQSRAYS